VELLNRFWLRDLISRALAEDIGAGDITTQVTVPADQKGIGAFVAKESGVICGLPILEEVFHSLNPSLLVTTWIDEGARINPGEILAEVQGSARSILSGERVALNLLQRLSGIATLTRTLVDQVSDLPVRIVDTRKTLPGMRFIEKYAVRTGGGHNHRFSLADAVLIKDNHIIAAGGITQAVQLARQYIPHTMTIEVEVESENQVKEALSAGVDIIMLDNMSPEMMRLMVNLIDGKALVEASGNINKETIRKSAETGVDIISVGALTHSANALDISLDLKLLS
jgi:nicotinate-nucleotide pyrophosphorylase (carboxylating)